MSALPHKRLEGGSRHPQQVAFLSWILGCGRRARLLPHHPPGSSGHPGIIGLVSKTRVLNEAVPVCVESQFRVHHGLREAKESEEGSVGAPGWLAALALPATAPGR